MAVGSTMKREVRVALSKKAQPVWFRVLKWIVLIVAIKWLWGSPYFWWWMIGALAVSFSVHFLWRFKTRGWTQPWGGWNDVETANRGDHDS